MRNKTATNIAIVGVWTMAAISGLTASIAVASVATVVLLYKRNKAFVELVKKNEEAEKEITLGKFK
jgi:hypothetical protein